MEVLLFTTDIHTPADVGKISPTMNTINDIEKWSVDIEDCDKVLRIVAASDITVQIKMALQHHGYRCNSMPLNLDTSIV